MSTKIAVIGSGIIGRTLATRFAQAGHVVTFGARHPGHAELAAFAAGIGAQVTDVGTAIDDADVVLLAINGAAMPEAVAAFGARLGGKTVIHATNRVGAPSLNSLAALARGPGSSGPSAAWAGRTSPTPVTATIPATCSTPALRARRKPPWRS